MTDQRTTWDRIGTYQRNPARYADASERHWWAAADQLVAGLELREGMRVLGVATGPGRAERLAAEHVGDRGTVIGIDTSDGMLAEARRRAAGVSNVLFFPGNMHDLDRLPLRSFDAAIQALSIYLADDGEHANVLAALRRRVKPGGRLGVSTCGVRYFSPLGGRDGVFVNAVRKVSDVPTWVPWDDTDTEDKVADLFTAAGMPNVELATQLITVSLTDQDGTWNPDAFWAIAADGTGYSRILEQLTPDQIRSVRQACADYVRANDLRELIFDVIHAHATVA